MISTVLVAEAAAVLEKASVMVADNLIAQEHVVVVKAKVRVGKNPLSNP